MKKPASVMGKLAWLARHCDSFRLEMHGENDGKPGVIEARRANRTGQIIERSLKFTPDDLGYVTSLLFDRIYESWAKDNDSKE